MRTRARELLNSLDSHDLDIDQKVASLSVGNRQRIEIARALAQDARVLIMDEPTAALAEADVQRLMAIVRNLCARGVAIIYVSHRMPEIFALAQSCDSAARWAACGHAAGRRSGRSQACVHDGGPPHRPSLSCKTGPEW